MKARDLIYNTLIYTVLDNFTLPVKTEHNAECFNGICKYSDDHPLQVTMTHEIPKHMYARCEIGGCNDRAVIAVYTFDHEYYTHLSLSVLKQSQLIDYGDCVYVITNIWSQQDLFCIWCTRRRLYNYER
jgi:hypothetical protein